MLKSVIFRLGYLPAIILFPPTSKQFPIFKAVYKIYISQLMISTI